MNDENVFNTINNNDNDNIIDNNRTIIINERIYNEYNKPNEYISESTNKLSPLIFRFNFTEDFLKELYIFSKVHQYDERKVFKEEWNLWLEQNEELVKIESKRLLDLNYTGNVLDKMFKSSRYYLRKKSNVTLEPKQRRKYISVNTELLNSMDRHITCNIHRQDYRPKTGFDEFCLDNIDVLKLTIRELCETNLTINVTDIKNKVKKTYKNRYFIATTK
jgi:hypothetical protein